MYEYEIKAKLDKQFRKIAKKDPVLYSAIIKKFLDFAHHDEAYK